MSLEELKGRAGATGDVGEKLAEMLSHAERMTYVIEGKHQAHLEAALAVAKLHAHVDKDIAEGRLQISFASEIEAASYYKKWITRAVEICRNLGDKAASEKLIEGGKQAALRNAMTLVERYHVNAVGQIKNLTAPPPAPEPARKKKRKTARERREEEEATKEAKTKHRTESRPRPEKRTKARGVG